MPLDDASIRVLQTNDRLRRDIHVSDCLQIHKGPRPAGGAFGAQHERFDVAIEKLFFLVRERFEFLENAIELRVVELEAQRLDPFAEGVSAAMFAQYEMAAGQTYVLGTQNLVRRMMLQHAMLMNAGLVSEGVLADDGLVARDGHARDAARPAARSDRGGWFECRW